MQTSSTTSTHDHDAEYAVFVEHMRQRFNDLTSDPSVVLYTTDTSKLLTVGEHTLYDAYLEAFPADQKQAHNCHTCRQFIERFGGLVTIDEEGKTRSVMWDYEPHGFYYAAIKAMQKRVESSKVTGVFYSDEKRWGIPTTGVWSHYSVNPAKHLVHKDRVKTAYQAAAEKSEDYRTMKRALSEFNTVTVGTALTLLQSEALYRSEKVLGPAQWLRNLHTARNLTKNLNEGANTLWRAIATAPAGFAHPRSSMIGTLLEDIASGMAFEDVKKRFAAKMNPLQYLRPQAAPSGGAIAAAEKLVEKLGIQRSLARRFARLDELQLIWSPRAAQTPELTGVFSHLKAKGTEEVQPLHATTAIQITWEKFVRTVLPTAEKISACATPHGHYGAYVTAVDDAAPPIIQWDRHTAPNPVTWYVYNGGLAASNWNIHGWTEVTGISLQPNLWQPGFEHIGAGAMLILKGARDLRRAQYPGNSLFPEFLKSELHSARSVIEAYSKSARLEGLEEASACGFMIQKQASKQPDVLVQVTVGGTKLRYAIDRWD